MDNKLFNLKIELGNRHYEYVQLKFSFSDAMRYSEHIFNT